MANGQLNREVKVVREPKSLMDMAIPWENKLICLYRRCLMTGIYKITNIQNGKIYVGQSNNIKRRWREHLSLTSTAHSAIRESIKKYGKESFIFEVLEECPVELLNERETYWIRELKSFGEGYNLNEGGEYSSRGENNGRARLTAADVADIRASYNNRERRRNVYERYKDKITFDSFASVWDGRAWSDIMPEVYTEENKKYYMTQATNGELSVSAILSNEEVLEVRKRYVNETAKEIWVDYKDRIALGTLQQILWGRTYKNLPIYKKKTKEWINL